MLSLLLALAQAVAVIRGSPAPCKHILKEIFSPAKEWVKQGPAPADHGFTMRIAMVQPQFEVLEQHLYAVSDPDSARYGEHLSMEEANGLMTPSPDALEAVNDWLVSHGFESHGLERSPSLDWVKISTTVQKAEEMLNTTYHVWKHSESGESIVRTTSWSVPDALADHIELVHPTTMFGGSMKPRGTTYLLDEDTPITLPKSTSPVATAVDPSCNTTITPSCLLQLYNAVNYKVQAASKGRVAISSYLGGY
ncbi:hypothetical protein M422DRAFT_50494 [Sphaerobolus stellatus SS14]|uniref:Peptidase S53 activation domain-containing protein n=1 Tax=Sphaerobolus stellatus (strain SS14) TaxID=990650 RepID=A0A0C9VJD3_SPHS4|nr:hypothetical protein M422DRAFT_50494 [Sphaerobolus stellatus SS14]